MTDLAILTEAGGAVGYGHLMRCLAIANNTDAVLYVNGDGDYPKNNCSKEYSWRTHLHAFISAHPASLSVLVDSYLADSHAYEILANYFNHVSVLDDYNRLKYPVDLIINPGIELPCYKNQNAKVVGGSKYIILRDEIIQQDKKSGYHGYQEILVTLGGRESSAVYDWLVPLLEEHCFTSIKIVTGNNENISSLSKKFNDPVIEWFGKVDAEKIAELMYQTNICISAGGQTLHELAYIGVPTICIKTGEDQEYNIAGYVKAGFLQENLSLTTCCLPQKINKLLDAYNNIELRQRTAEKGKVMVDGQGVKCIAEILL
ncbi:MAG: hypothetical protein OEW99_00320 [Gammaproteobacteria bacterium]|nr:hypothetical protein [Gammaproteobacteria bacterium]